MSIAFPPKSFETPARAFSELQRLFVEGFENPNGRRGTVRVSLSGFPELSYLAEFKAHLDIRPDTPGTPVETEIEFAPNTLTLIFEEYEFLDWRDPRVIGNTRISGDRGLAFHLGLSCLRPSDDTQTRFEIIEALHAVRNYRHLDQITRLHKPTQMDILTAIEDSLPIIATGMTPGDEQGNWSLDMLSDRFGDSIVTVRSASEQVTMREFTTELNDVQDGWNDPTGGGKSVYTNGTPLPLEMWDAFGPLCFDKEDFVPPQLWFGAVPTSRPATNLHRDTMTGFLHQVIGRKRLNLYSADQADLLYPMKAYNSYQRCWFDPSSPDWGAFPKAQTASCMSIELMPGELLIQPAGWFHQVYALDSPTMSVSYFWRY